MPSVTTRSPTTSLTFSKKKKKKELFFSICSAVVSTGLGTLRNRQGLPRGAAALEKSGLTWATSDLYPHGHRALREASE